MTNYLVQEKRNKSLLARINGSLHERFISLFMVIVLGHWLEHLVQVYQVYALGWAPKAAGGLLGLWFPHLAASEVLHFTYNSLILAGILLLLPGFAGRSRRWWWGAVVAGTWHFFEHLILQIQWLTGYYLFGASAQMGIGQLWIPRVELHFMYNLIVFIPLVVGMYYHFYPPQHEVEEAPCTCARTGLHGVPGDSATTTA
jgi:hypothetical protein